MWDQLILHTYMGVVYMNFPKAKGSTKGATGLKPVLINDRNKSFIVDPKVFIIWSLCNGRNTLDEIRSKFGDKLGVSDMKKVDCNVEGVIDTLTKIGLMET